MLRSLLGDDSETAGISPGEKLCEVYHLVMTHIAMENDPFIDDFPIKTSIYSGFSMAMLNNQMVWFGAGLGLLSNIPSARIPLVSFQLPVCV